MGRDSTGAWNVSEAFRLELSWLLKNGYIRKNCMVSGALTWKDQRGHQTGRVGFSSCYTSSEYPHLKLYYTVTDSSGEKVEYSLEIELHEQPSNLGKGNVLYFICPESGNRCRILYMAYESHIFKCRQAYRQRLYYDCQQSSKLNIYNDNYWKLDCQLRKIERQACRGERTFKGQLTKAAKRYNQLYKQRDKMDNLRWTKGVPKAIKAFL